MIYPKLSTAIDKYISEILSQKSEWYERGQKSQLKYWKRVLGEYRINQITPKMIQLPNHLLPSSRNRYLTSLSCVYTHYGNGINPTKNIKKYKEGKGRVRFLSDDERIRLLETLLKSTHPHIYAIVVVALSTGMRKNEILKLTHKQVDLQRKLIYLPTSKNGEPRMIPLGGHVLELIINLRTSQPEWCKICISN